MPGKYVFISNGTKPTSSERASRAPVALTNFSRPCLETAAEMGFEVYLGVNRDSAETLTGEPGIRYYDAHTYRSVLDVVENVRALRNLLRLLRQGNFELIHCNTPIGGLVGRIGGALGRVPRVVYTAHGFHFYNGGHPLRNRLFRSAEHFLARFTDVIIAINQEDYDAALSLPLRRGGRVYMVPGVGVDAQPVSEDFDREAVRREIGVPRDAVVFSSAGDLIARKDFETAVRALAQTGQRDYHLVICGEGPEMTRLANLSDSLGVHSQVHLLGRRSDVATIFRAADSLLFTSVQEGLPRVVMEAMVVGLPCIVSRIRGNVDLVSHGVNGFLCAVGDPSDFARRMLDIGEDRAIAESMGAKSLERSAEFSVDQVRERLRVIYRDVIEGTAQTG